MSTFPVGQDIFKNRWEYPLPQKQAVQDYLFYFVPAGDPYGKAARDFFDRFYKDHQRQNISSLEALMAHLESEVTQRGVNHIREIIILAHGTAQGLIAPVVNGASDTNLPHYKYVTPGSLISLQADLLAGQFTSFKTKRNAVLSHLTEDSWITIRACNFGRSKEGMYALYAFFGGKANVYCPKVYQFFGPTPIAPEMRFETLAATYEHLRKQRLLTRGNHTPKRQEALVKFFSFPGRFSEASELITADVNQPTAPETVEYEEIRRRLNAKVVNSSLRDRLNNEAGITLSSKKKVYVKTRDVAWLIRDELPYENKKYFIEYHLEEEYTQPSTVKLVVESKLTRYHINDNSDDSSSDEEKYKILGSLYASIPIQLFFFEGDNNLYRNRLFTLAFHSEEPGAAPEDLQRFNAIMSLLESRQLSDPSNGGLDLTVIFDHEGHELPQTATISGNRSGCQNLALAMPSFHGVPYGHGHAPDLTPTTLEPDSIRSPGLYSDTGSASGKP